MRHGAAIGVTFGRSGRLPAKRGAFRSAGMHSCSLSANASLDTLDAEAGAAGPRTYPNTPEHWQPCIQSYDPVGRPSGYAQQRSRHPGVSRPKKLTLPCAEKSRIRSRAEYIDAVSRQRRPVQHHERG